jgi:hypothetical protein
MGPSVRGVRVSIGSAGTLPEIRGNERTLKSLLKRLVLSLISHTPKGSVVRVTARAVRGRGPRTAGGKWVEIGVHAPKARLGEKQLDRVLRSVGPLTLVDMAADFYRGELRIVLVCRLGRISNGWFIIRRGANSVPSFAVVLPAATSRLS